MLKTNRGLIKFILLTIVTLGIYSLFFLHDMAHEMNIACNGDGKHTRGLFAYILLSIITLGIYALVWNYGVCERVATHCHRRGVQPPVTGGSWLLWNIFGILLFGLGPFIAFHKQCKGVNLCCADYNSAGRQYGSPMGGNPMGGAPVVNININR